MAIERLTVNVPTTARLKYADEVEGEYGMQIKLKCADDRTIYVPVDCAADLLALGAKREDTPKGVTYRHLPTASVVIEKAQPAGAKAPHTTIRAEGAPAPDLGAPPDGEGPPPNIPPAGTQPVASAANPKDVPLLREWLRVFRAVRDSMDKSNADHPQGIQFDATSVTTTVNGLMITIARGL